jgi:hypothetical protein
VRTFSSVDLDFPFVEPGLEGVIPKSSLF